VVQVVLWYLDSSCSKHMTGDRSRLRNFVKKFIETVRFGNDHFGAIMGYGDYVIGDSVISREALILRHDEVLPNLLVVQSLQEQIMVMASTVEPLELQKSKKHTYTPKAENTNLEVLNTLHMDLFPKTPQQNGVVERQNRTLVEAARTMLIFSKALMFLWAEAVATVCYTQNRTLIYTCHNKTSYDLVHDKKSDLSFFQVFGALCYPTNDSEDLGKLQPTADIGIFVGYAPSKKGYRIYNKRTRRIMETIHV
ncbi:retrovirus-related pol polyprotein from transposon TNT 1-94, partial [Tanacetum coccineum]